jgi:hypothetical protein
MKRILFSIVCISLVSACFAGVDVSDKNAQLIKVAKDGNLQAVQKLLGESESGIWWNLGIRGYHIMALT